MNTPAAGLGPPGKPQARREATSQTGPEISGAANDTIPRSVAHQADTEPALRMPCRTRGCSGTRPVVLLGSSWGWDRCRRCARRNLRAQPLPVPDDRPYRDPWQERVAELLDAAELAGAGRSA